MKVSQMLPSIPDFASECVAALRGVRRVVEGRRGPVPAPGGAAHGCRAVRGGRALRPVPSVPQGPPRERNPRAAFIGFA